MSSSRKLGQGKGNAQCIIQTMSKPLEKLESQCGGGQGRSNRRNVECSLNIACPLIHHATKIWSKIRIRFLPAVCICGCARMCIHACILAFSTYSYSLLLLTWVFHHIRKASVLNLHPQFKLMVLSPCWGLEQPGRFFRNAKAQVPSRSIISKSLNMWPKPQCFSKGL